jgi:hypothetical protein
LGTHSLGRRVGYPWDAFASRLSPSRRRTLGLCPSISARESAAMFKLRTSGSAGASRTATAGLCCFSRASPWGRALRHPDSFRLSRDVTVASSGCGSVQIEHILEPQNLYLPSALLVVGWSALNFLSNGTAIEWQLISTFGVLLGPLATSQWLNSASNTYIKYSTLLHFGGVSTNFALGRISLTTFVESKPHNGPRACNIRSHIFS